jgi:tetratricopeptide (TPR) repeat protein
MKHDRSLLEYLLAQSFEIRGPCPVPERLRDFVNGDLDTGEAEKVRDHVSVCPWCMEELFFAPQVQKEYSASLREGVLDLLSRIWSYLLPNDLRSAGYAFAFTRGDSGKSRQKLVDTNETYRGKDYAETLKKLHEIAAETGVSELLFFDMGICHLAMHHYRMAEKCFAGAIAKREKVAEFWWYHCITLVKQGKLDGAINDLEHILTLGSDYTAEARMLLAHIAEGIQAE